jgi:hypothetical protein
MAPGVGSQNRRSRVLFAEGHPPKEGEGCAQNMVRGERNELHRVVSLDERDHALLLSLLEHKVLTTRQIKACSSVPSDGVNTG